MSQEFTEEMEKALLNLRKEIVESLASEDEDFKSLVSSMGIKDDGDAASDDMMIKKIEALNQIAANRLKSVDAALARIKNHRYGMCLQCGTKIPEDRLRAIPYAVLCIACKSGQEGGRRRDW